MIAAALRSAIEKIPTREERLGSQTFKYVKLSEVLDLLDTFRNTHETGEQQPVAYVPIHPRAGPLWANTIPTLESERPAHYPLMALYAEPASIEGKETVVRTNQGDSDCVMTGDWPLTRERDAASHPPSCTCYTCIQNRWRASQKAKVVLPTCAHGATSEEVCPECMGLPSDNPDEEIS